MCTEAYCVDGKGFRLNTIGDIKAIAPTVVWHDLHPDGYERFSDDICLCPVDIPQTLEGAGYKVWLNPDMIPEYFFQKDANA